MNPHPTLAHELLNAHCDQLRREAATDRLIHELRGDRPHAGDLLLTRLGDALVAAGSHLRERRFAAGATPMASAPRSLPVPLALANMERQSGALPAQELAFCFVRYDASRDASTHPTLTWMVMGTTVVPGH